MQAHRTSVPSFGIGRPRRLSWSAHGLESERGPRGLGGQGELPIWSGTVATAGDLVFYGTMDGWFKALNATNGLRALEIQDRVGNHLSADQLSGPRPQTVHRRVGRRGRLAGAAVVADLDPRDHSAANGFVHPMADLKAATKKGGAVYVFGLP